MDKEELRKESRRELSGELYKGRGEQSGKETAARIIVAAVFALICLFVWVRNPAYFWTETQEGVRTLQTSYAAVCGVMAVIIFCCLLLPKKYRLSRKAGWIGSFICLFLWPVLDYCISEMAMDTGCDFLHILRFSLLMNIFLYCVIEGVLAAVTLNIRVAVEGGALVCFVFSAANIYLMEFRQIPLYMTDLVDVQTAGDVVGNYTFGLTRGIWLLLLFLVMTVLLMHRIWPFGQKYIRKHRAVSRTVLSLGAGAVLMYTIYYMIFTGTPGWRGVKMSSFRPVKSYIRNGGLLSFVVSGKFLVVEKPDGYSVEAVEVLDAQYTSDVYTADEKTPNIIVIMNEALADLQTVGNFETNTDVLPFLHGLEENTVKGSLYVSVFGGHTANTEYEFLTGDSYELCPSGTPYVLYIKNAMENLTTGMKALGSAGNLAMHPNTASNYNRTNVYDHFGFDEFLSISDFADAERVRGHVSDAADFQKIIEQYETVRAQSDAPFYLFNVTMQNHSGYASNDENLPQVIDITTEGIADEEEAERYLNLIHLTDQSFSELVEYFTQVDDPTVIVMFGDHEPGLSTAFYDSIFGKSTSDMSAEEQMLMYQTPFVIWANYDIEEEQDISVSANYLQTKMKQVLGLPLTGYDKYLSQLMEKLPVLCAAGSLDSEGNYYDVKSEDNPYAEDVKAYAMLVYNHLFDAKNRADMFAPASS